MDVLATYVGRIFALLFFAKIVQRAESDLICLLDFYSLSNLLKSFKHSTHGNEINIMENKAI